MNIKKRIVDKVTDINDPQLLDDFIQEFEDAVQRLIKFPKAGHPCLHQTKHDSVTST